MTITAPHDQEEYLQTLAELDHKHVEAQRTSRQTSQAVKEAAHKLMIAVSHYETDGPRPTQRDLIAQVNETARMQAAGELPGPPQDVPGPSAIDRFAFYTREQGRSAGGGGSFRRGNTTRKQPRSMSSSPPQQPDGRGPSRPGTVR